MSSVRQAHAAQFSAAALLMTAALTAFPLLAADQYEETYYAGQIVQIFQKMGAETPGIYANGSLDTSAFDFASYFGNTCFRPTEFDMAGCKEKFGPYANLKETYDSGKLAMILSKVSYLADIAKLLPQPYGARPTSSSESSTSSSASSTSSSSSSVSSSAASEPQSFSSSWSSSMSSNLMDREDRASQVWELCTKKYNEHKAAISCYQRNIRLIMDRMEPVDESLVY